MKRRSPAYALFLVSGLVPAVLVGSPYVTNFVSLNGSVGAEGVWRDDATTTDLGIPVTITQAGGAVMSPTAANPSVIDDTFPWMDAAPHAPNLFEPNFSGDFINVEVLGGESSVITIDFGAVVVDPVISVSGIAVQTVLNVSSAFTVIAQAGNMVFSPFVVSADGTAIPFLGDETSGSLQVNGNFTRLTMTLVNFGTDPFADRDQAGFVFSTLVEPAALPSLHGLLEVEVVGPNLVLSWPDTSTFSSIECSPDMEPSNWSTLAGADPKKVTSISMPVASLGEAHYFRGVGQF